MSTAEARKLDVHVRYPRIVRKPEFIKLNDLERMCNKNSRLAVAGCMYSTKIKRNKPLGRGELNEFHNIKDWFALIPNEDAKAFADWILDLAAEAHQKQFEGEYEYSRNDPEEDAATD